MKKILSFALLCFFLLAVVAPVYASPGRLWIGSSAVFKPGSIRDKALKISRSIPGVISLQFLKQKERVHIYVLCQDKNQGPSIVTKLRKRFKEELGLVLDTKNKPNLKGGEHN